MAGYGPNPGPGSAGSGRTIWYGEDMLETVVILVDEIYIPVKRRKDLDAAKVEALAESILEEGQRTPIQVRPDKERYVLVTGLHRLEAVKALGEETVQALVVRTGELMR